MRKGFVVLVAGALVALLAACSGSAPAAPSPTATPVPPTPTYTPAPTATATAAPTPAATPTPTPGGKALFTLSADKNPNRFMWISGTNANGSTPPDPTNINLWPLVVHAGQPVEITINVLGGTHNTSVYPPTEECMGGHCAGELASSGEVDPGDTISLSFSYPTASSTSTLYLVCNEHPGMMRTTISVIP
ncbi:MAG: hypothetical protein HY685_06915 [Chloroflexi bacterium]|nr:hypothetical protein [Chloroflexota bacterium]